MLARLRHCAKSSVHSCEWPVFQGSSFGFPFYKFNRLAPPHTPPHTPHPNPHKPPPHPQAPPHTCSARRAKPRAQGLHVCRWEMFFFCKRTNHVPGKPLVLPLFPWLPRCSPIRWAHELTKAADPSLQKIEPTKTDMAHWFCFIPYKGKWKEQLRMRPPDVQPLAVSKHGIGMSSDWASFSADLATGKDTGS